MSDEHPRIEAFYSKTGVNMIAVWNWNWVNRISVWYKNILLSHCLRPEEEKLVNASTKYIIYDKCMYFSDPKLSFCPAHLFFHSKTCHFQLWKYSLFLALIRRIEIKTWIFPHIWFHLNLRYWRCPTKCCYTLNEMILWKSFFHITWNLKKKKLLMLFQLKQVNFRSVTRNFSGQGIIEVTFSFHEFVLAYKKSFYPVNSFLRYIQC